MRKESGPAVNAGKNSREGDVFKSYIYLNESFMCIIKLYIVVYLRINFKY